MTTLRCYIDPDQQSATRGPTFFKTERNQQEVRCGTCARIEYVDEEIFRFVSDAINAGLDNPFRCEICQEEGDELVYEG
jgi:hypothetical protein